MLPAVHAQPDIGTLIDGKYRIERVLGTGGMGAVLAATRLSTGTEVAIKVMHRSLLDHPEMVKRFTLEAIASGKLRSEHVCRVFDADVLPDGTPYIVMELLVGEDLATLAKLGPLRPARACELLAQACLGLVDAHQQGLVHRDLKPGNLFLARRPGGGECVKLLDFGIVKMDTSQSLTVTEATFGTPAYMSPEQLQSAKHVDARSDIWAIGILLYELVVGHRPFLGESVMDVAIKVATTSYAPLPPHAIAIEAIIDRCLQKDPERRYPDAEALRADLLRVASGATLVRPSSPPTAGVTVPARPAAALPTLEERVTEPRARPTPSPTPSPSPSPPPSPSPERGTRRGVLVLGAALAIAIGVAAALVLSMRSHDDGSSDEVVATPIVTADGPPAPDATSIAATAVIDAAVVDSAREPTVVLVDAAPLDAAVDPAVGATALDAAPDATHDAGDVPPIDAGSRPTRRTRPRDAGVPRDAEDIGDRRH